MKKIALIYSFNTKNSSKIAQEIKKVFGDDVDELNAEEIDGDKFLQYKYMILGVPTWFDGELPNYWDEFVPELETLNLKGKKVAIYGLGDQVKYPENFVDGIGLMGKIVQNRGAVLIGFTSIDGYNFEKSKAISNNKFTGLALDLENQSELTSKRIKNWVTDLKKEFK